MNPDAVEIRKRLDDPDSRLLGECEIHTYRASGPGGQKRNKTFSAVRLHHPLSDITVLANESRSQHENKAKALRRLREAIALKYRLEPPDKAVFPENVQIVEHRLKVNSHNPALPHVLALVLDALDAYGCVHQKAAAFLDVTPSSLLKFLSDHPKAWAEYSRMRKIRGMDPIRRPA